MRPRQNPRLERTETLFSRRRHDDADHLKFFEQQLADDNLHRTELFSLVDLKTNLARIGGVVVYISDLVAVNPYLKMVGLGMNLYRVPAFAVHERLVLIHGKKHLAGTVQRARIAHRFLIFEDVSLIRLLR